MGKCEAFKKPYWVTSLWVQKSGGSNCMFEMNLNAELCLMAGSHRLLSQSTCPQGNPSDLALPNHPPLVLPVPFSVTTASTLRLTNILGWYRNNWNAEVGMALVRQPSFPNWKRRDKPVIMKGRKNPSSFKVRHLLLVFVWEALHLLANLSFMLPAVLPTYLLSVVVILFSSCAILYHTFHHCHFSVTLPNSVLPLSENSSTGQPEHIMTNSASKHEYPALTLGVVVSS